jgi:ribokinase
MLIVFGSINLDLAFQVPKLPAPGETVLGPAYGVSPGGKGANQAVAAARDGAAVVMVGRIGRDAFAEPALAGLRAAGIDLSLVAAGDEPTGCAAICVDPQGENQIAVAAGANAAVRADLVPDALLDSTATLLMQMETPPSENAALIARARARGARIVLNLAPAGALPEAAIGALDALVVNEGEAAALAGLLGVDGDSARVSATVLALKLGVATIVTMGADGTDVAAADGTSWREPAPMIAPVDTTAAGDAFVGVLAGALDRGADLRAAVRRAVVAGALACTKRGAQPSLPSRAEIDAALARGAAA